METHIKADHPQRMLDEIIIGIQTRITARDNSALKPSGKIAGAKYDAVTEGMVAIRELLASIVVEVQPVNGPPIPVASGTPFAIEAHQLTFVNEYGGTTVGAYLVTNEREKAAMAERYRLGSSLANCIAAFWFINGQSAKFVFNRA